MKRVFLAEREEPWLPYHSTVQYQRDMQHFTLPCDATTLLKHARALHEFLDDVAVAIDATIPVARTEPVGHDPLDRFACLDDDEPLQQPPPHHSGYSQQEMQRICTVLWNWYCDVRQRHCIGQSLLPMNRFYFFMAFVRAFRLAVCNSGCEKHELYTAQCVEQLDYYREVSARYNIVVCDTPLGELSITELWNSIRLALRSLYTYSYSPAMRHYVHALFYRFATLVDCEHPEAGLEIFDDARFVLERNEMEDEQRQQAETLASDREDETVRTLIDAFPAQSIPINDRLSLSHAFVREGDKLLFHQLFRLRLSARLQARDSFTVPYTDVRERHRLMSQALDAWRLFMLDVAENKKLRHFVLDAQGGFKELLVGVHMYHGEKERYREANPEQADSDREVLMEMRPNDLIEINKTHGMTVRSIVDIFYTEMRLVCFGSATADAQDPTAPVDYQACERTFPAPLYEAECLLLTRICTNVWYTSSGLKQPAALQETYIFEEQTTLERIERVLFDLNKPLAPEGKKPAPLLLRVQRLYYVVLPSRGRRVYTTHLFIEAFLLWQALWVLHGLLPRELVHPKLQSALAKIITLLNFDTLTASLGSQRRNNSNSSTACNTNSPLGAGGSDAEI